MGVESAPLILLLGKDGQLGWELQRALAPLGRLVALGRDGADGLCGDLSDAEGLRATVRRLAPDVIVNAAAYTAVDRAEAEPGAARAVNADAPGLLAREATAGNALLVHYSTDYVFDGEGSHWRGEDDPAAPLSIYGRSKWEGEEAVRIAGGRHLIFRTSWLYGARGGNFAKTMLRLARERDRLAVVADQIGAPTGADLVADVTAHALRADRWGEPVHGTYHLAAAGETSWHGYAGFVLDYAEGRGHPLRVRAGQVEAIGSADYVSAARRPLNSRLSTRKLRARLGIELPDWRLGVGRMLAEHLGDAP